ncbi:MAG: type II secretion system F family protein [Actinomycetota bacterium]
MGKRKNIIDRIRRPSSYPASKETDEGSIKKINLWLNRNNLGFSLKEFYVLLLIISTLPILAGLLLKLNLIACLVLSLISVFSFFIFIKVKNSRENIKKEEQMEQFLMDLTANLYSNPNVIKCIDKAVKDIDNPLKREFEMVVDESRRGILLNNCLKNMIRRNNSQLIEIILLGFIAANDKGVDLVSFLDSQIEYIREKRSLKNYIRILSSGPRYTSYLIMLIPLISILIISFINENFVKMMFSGTGLAVIIYAIFSYITGILLINKIVNLNEGRRP